MGARLDALKQEVDKLSEAERAELALALIRSLDGASNAEDIEQAWALEAERRAEQIDRGEVRPVPGDAVITRLRRKLG